MVSGRKIDSQKSLPMRPTSILFAFSVSTFV